MADIDEAEYEELDRYYTDPDIPIHGVGRVWTGEAAAAYGLAFMLEEYGSMEAIEVAIEEAREFDARRVAEQRAVGS
jgi:hypothetical protein